MTFRVALYMQLIISGIIDQPGNQVILAVKESK